MRLKNLDLVMVMLISVMNVGEILLPNHPSFIGIILALPLVFLLPGYTLTEVLFYKRSSDVPDQLILKPRLKINYPLNGSERFILSLGLSLTIDILSGFILNLLPIGLRPLSWAVFLGLIATVLSLFAAYLRHRTHMAANRVTLPRFTINIYESILFGLALVVAILSILYSSRSISNRQLLGFTQLWLLPSNQINNSCAVSIGIHSFESTSVTYRVVMTMNQSEVKTWPSIVLAPQGEWDRLVPITVTTTSNMFVQVQLYRLDKPGSVYRDVHLTLHSLKGSKNRQGQQCTT